MSTPADMTVSVGPVLLRGPVGDAVLAAILARAPHGTCIDRGAYVRVLVPGRCTLARADVEASLGRPFVLPGDLEGVMPSFKGVLVFEDDAVIWQSGLAPRPGGTL